MANTDTYLNRVIASVAKAQMSNKADLDYGFALYTFQGESICRHLHA
jgi:hypothetical protein